MLTPNVFMPAQVPERPLIHFRLIASRAAGFVLCGACFGRYFIEVKQISALNETLSPLDETQRYAKHSPFRPAILSFHVLHGPARKLISGAC